MSTTQQTDIPTSDGTRIAVREWTPPGKSGSDTRALLLLHGWPASGETFVPLVESLRLAGFAERIIAPDLRGYGDSDKPATGYTCEIFAADVLTIAETLNLRSYVLAGHSMGGKIAQLVAASRPAELAALVLLTPGLLAPSPPVDVSARLAAYGDAERTRVLVAGFAAHPLEPAHESLITRDGLRTGREAWNGWLQTMRSEGFADRAAQIAVPTLVIGGGKDPQRTEAELQTGVVAQIAGATYARLPLSGHLPHLEEPDTLAALLLPFLDGLA